MLEHLKNTDFGTPISLSEELVTLQIDGREVTVPKGTSLMRAAVDGGIKVPKLCATDSLEPFGSCRLCLVQIEGRKGFPASCTTPAEAGMKVKTQSPRLQELRKGVMELYISDHPLDCLTCSSNGDCELQDMAGVVGLREVRYGMNGANHFKDEAKPTFYCDTVEMFNTLLKPEQVKPVRAVMVQDMGKADWEQPRGNWFDARTGIYVLGSKRKGSMGPTIASFVQEADARAFANQYGGKVLRFGEITLGMVDLSGGAQQDTRM